MTKDNNYSVEPVWDENDDLAEMMDAVLRAPGLRNACLSDPDCNWAMFIGDKDMEEGITSLPPLEQEILKLFFLEGLPLMDIASRLDISIELVHGHIKSMKVRLRCYV